LTWKLSRPASMRGFPKEKQGSKTTRKRPKGRWDQKAKARETPRCMNGHLHDVKLLPKGKKGGGKGGRETEMGVREVESHRFGRE